MKTVFFYSTAIGEIGIAADETAVTNLYFGREAADGLPIKETFLLRQAAEELHEYLDGVRQTFDLPLAPAGTAFQQTVWQALREIPYGHTRSYQEIAEQIGRPKAYRAVGMANHRNPLAVFIPCHRVIGKDGDLTGYAGGLALKTKLLNLEKARFRP